METTPVSDYSNLYQEELQKMRDEVKMKSGEKIVWE